VLLGGLWLGYRRAQNHVLATVVNGISHVSVVVHPEGKKHSLRAAKGEREKEKRRSCRPLRLGEEEGVDHKSSPHTL